jgi:uncharacterized membrane protein YGL010W
LFILLDPETTLLLNELVLERIELLILETELIELLLMVDMLEFEFVKPLTKLLFVKLILLCVFIKPLTISDKSALSANSRWIVACWIVSMLTNVATSKFKTAFVEQSKLSIVVAKSELFTV